MSAYYSAARMWEGLCKIPQQIAAASRSGFIKSHKRPRPPPTAFPQYEAPTTMPYLPSTTPSSSVTTEPMDLDAMSVARDPRKIPPTLRCYNCNEVGHLERDCPKPQRRQTPSADNKSFRGRS